MTIGKSPTPLPASEGGTGTTDALASALALKASLLAPLSLPNLAAYYDASLEAYANNDPAGTVTDRSGNARHATSTGSARPTFKTNLFGTRPGFQYTKASGTYSATAAFTLGQPVTVIMLCRLRAYGALDTIWDGAALNTMRMFTGANYQLYAGTYGPADVASEGKYPVLLIGEYNGTSSRISIDWDKPVGGVDAGSGPGGGFSIGDAPAAGQGSDLDMGYAVVLTGLLTPVQRQQHIAWAAQTWGF